MGQISCDLLIKRNEIHFNFPGLAVINCYYLLMLDKPVSVKLSFIFLS